MIKSHVVGSAWLLLLYFICTYSSFALAKTKRIQKTPYFRYIVKIQKKLKKRPKSVQLRTILGRLYQKSGFFAKAELEYKKVLAHKPRYSHALVGLAHILLYKGQLSRATRLLKKVLQKHPKHASAWAEKSELLRLKALKTKNKNKRKEYLSLSLQSIQRAIIFNPKSHRYRYRLGVIYLSKKQYMMAHMQFAVAHAQLTFHPCYKLGLVSSETLLMRKRKGLFQELKLGVQQCRHHLLRGIGQSLLVLLGTQRAQKFADSKRLKQAVEVMAETVRLAPQVEGGYLFLALLQVKNNQCAGARKTLLALLQRNPKHKGAKKLLYHSSILGCSLLPSKRFFRKTYKKSKRLYSHPKSSRKKSR